MTHAIALPVIQASAGGLVPCTSCGKCCTYVGVGINAPTSLRYATDVLWYLYHDKVSVYLDGDGEWSVLFESRCRQLQDDLLCRIYPQRPHVCRAFDNTGCEVNRPDAGRTFTQPREFLDWLKRARPRVHRRLARTYLAPDAR